MQWYWSRVFVFADQICYHENLEDEGKEKRDRNAILSREIGKLQVFLYSKRQKEIERKKTIFISIRINPAIWGPGRP